MNSGRMLLSFIALSFPLITQARVGSEPAFCNPAAFKKLENATNVNGLERAHIYKIGKLTLAGLGVGNSKTPSVEQLASQVGQNLSSREKSCTWYLNDGNDQAAKAFIHRYVERPTSNASRSVAEYENVLQSSFDRDAVNFVSCAEDHGYVAIGCDGMRHRGPSVVAMFLSFAGCSAEHSVEIVNSIWGSNGISTTTRVALAQRAFDIGNERPDARARLQAVLNSK